MEEKITLEEEGGMVAPACAWAGTRRERTEKGCEGKHARTAAKHKSLPYPCSVFSRLAYEPAPYQCHHEST